MIIFRVDGNPRIGLGHIMRNISIADAFSELGEKSCFVLADDELIDLISSHGHAVRTLGTRYNKMYEEINEFQTVISSMGDTIALFVDSYFVTEQYFNDLHSICKENNIMLAYIDDVAKFPYDCDFLINYNIFAMEDIYQRLYQNHKIPELLLGTSFVPLRKEFQHLPYRIVKSKAKEILVSTGGSDNEHVGMEFISTIMKHRELDDYHFHFVLGAVNNDKQEIEKLAEIVDNVHLHENAIMSKLMQSCDIAISAAGSTLYELCATQTPTITYVVADNQILGAETFERENILFNAGSIKEVGLEKLSEDIVLKVIDLIDNDNIREKIANRMKVVVDGFGSMRIAETIMKISLQSKK